MENHFKNKLKNHKVDWNKEDLLLDLEAALSVKKKSFKKKWFFLDISKLRALSLISF